LPPGAPPARYTNFTMVLLWGYVWAPWVMQRVYF
jgi:hypothetical protein